jgi:hypothetical protein
VPPEHGSLIASVPARPKPTADAEVGADQRPAQEAPAGGIGALVEEAVATLSSLRQLQHIGG